jgi:septal ring factor EnvC (AmiA/AmiB activator)
MIVKHWQLNWTVGGLQEYIESKLNDLRKKYSITFEKKVAAYITMLEQILEFEYFRDIPRLTTRYFIGIIKEDREDMLEYVEQQKGNLKKQQKAYDSADQQLKAFSEKQIMDERDEEAFSERMRLETSVNEAYSELTTIEYYVKECEITADRLHKLLGIIARADAFFEKVL